MSSKLMDAIPSGSKTTTSVRSNTSQVSKSEKPPKGAEIIEKNISTETEEIENGWLITKRCDGRYRVKGDTDTYGHYFSMSKKWYSKTDPLTITVNDKSLADAFDDEELS